MTRTFSLSAVAVAVSLFCGVPSYAQKTKEIEALAQQPKSQKQFPVAYQMVLPSSDLNQWNADYERYKKFITPAMQQTQMGMSFTDKAGIRHWMITNSIIPMRNWIPEP